MEDVFVGLGSNVDDPLRQIRAALVALAEAAGTQLVTWSDFYRSAPHGPVEQPDFVNAVAHVRTTCAPHEFLDLLLEIEYRQGRRRSAVRWGPRPIDLDLLVFGRLCMADERLTVPHPRLSQRRFVLEPLVRIAPELVIPGLGNVSELLEICNDAPIRRLIGSQTVPLSHQRSAARE